MSFLHIAYFFALPGLNCLPFLTLAASSAGVGKLLDPSNKL